MPCAPDYPVPAEERLSLTDILQVAADTQLRALNAVGAVSSLETALGLMRPDDWQTAHERAWKLWTASFQAYLSTGELAKARAAADKLDAHAASELEGVKAGHAQIQILGLGASVPPAKGSAVLTLAHCSSSRHESRRREALPTGSAVSRRRPR